MEGVFLPTFCDVGLERPRNVCSDERVTSAEVGVHAELLFDSAEGGVDLQAGCYLSAVLDRKQLQVAVALLEHEVVGLPELFGRGLEGEPGIGEARFGEGGIGAVLLAFLGGLGLCEMGGDSLAPGRESCRHVFCRTNHLGVGSCIFYSVTGATVRWQRCE